MKLRNVRFADEQSCIADIERLRTGHRSGGSWTLAQACFHLKFPIEQSLRSPGNPTPTPDQAKNQGFVDQVAKSGWPDGLSSPAPMVPPADAGADAIDGLLAGLKRLAEYKAPLVDSFIFGPLATEKFRQFALIHAGHHLSFFEPA